MVTTNQPESSACVVTSVGSTQTPPPKQKSYDFYELKRLNWRLLTSRCLPWDLMMSFLLKNLQRFQPAAVEGIADTPAASWLQFRWVEKKPTDASRIWVTFNAIVPDCWDFLKVCLVLTFGRTSSNSLYSPRSRTSPYRVSFLRTVRSPRRCFWWCRWYD